MRPNLNRRRFVAASLAAALVQGRGNRASAEQPYRVADIGGLAGTGDGRFASLVHVYPSGLTNDGTVVANASDVSVPVDRIDPVLRPAGWSMPFTVSGGKTRRIGRERSTSLALAINTAGSAVGFEAARDSDGIRGRATVWRNGEIEHLPGLGGDFGIARGINAAGDLVGACNPEGGGDAIQAVVWRQGDPLALPGLGGQQSIANDINETGGIAGAAVATAIRYQPVLWVDDAIVSLPLPRFWVAGEALAVNQSGIAVGGGYLEFSEAPMRWADGGYEQLPGFAERVTGVAVGRVYVATRDYTGYVAVRWDASGVVDLNGLVPPETGFVLVDAVAINERGQILVAAADGDDVPHALLLSPA